MPRASRGLLLALPAAGALFGAGPIETPKEETAAYYPPLSGDLRLGVVAKLTRRSGCGAARVVAATRAVHDVNTRNATFCPAIARLGPADLFNVSFDVMDHGGDSERAIQAGMYFSGIVGKSGFGLYGQPVHGIIGFTTSGASADGAKAMQALGMPMVCYSATSPLLSLRVSGELQYPNFFRVCPGDQNRVRAAARAISQFGYTSVVSFYFSNDYTRSMCNSFASAATFLGMTVVSKEVPTTDGNSGSPPDENAKQRIREVLTEIHEDPSMPRVIMLCAFDAELPEVLRQAESMGLRKREHNYVWFHPDDGGFDDLRDALGTFSVSWIPDSDRTPLFKQAWNSGDLRAGGFEYKLGESICGSSQNESCWAMPRGETWNEDYGDFFRYVDNTTETAQNSFDFCKPYTQFGYDSVVMYSAAMHKGLDTGVFTKESVTSALLEEMLRSLVNDTRYGECLAGGNLAFNADQERNLPFMVKNVYLDADNVARSTDVVMVPYQTSDALLYQASSHLASCSTDYPAEKCFRLDGGGPLSGRFPLGRAATCADGAYWHKGGCVPADLGYYVPKMAAGQAAPYRAQIACPAGSYTNATGQTVCAPSRPGHFASEDSTSEVPCAPGTFSDERGAAVCTECAAGDFQEQRGQTSCSRCEVGRYQDESGRSSCIGCPAGRTTEAITGEAWGATANAHGASDASSCYPCEPGEYSVNNRPCAQCGAGTVAPSYGSTECQQCPAGKSSTEGSAECESPVSYIVGCAVAAKLLAVAAVLLSLSAWRIILIDDISRQGNAVVVTSAGRHLLVQWPMCLVGGSLPVCITAIPVGTRNQLQSVQDAMEGQFRVRRIDQRSLELLTAEGLPIIQRVDASTGRLELPVLMGFLCTGRSNITVAVIVPLLLTAAAAIIYGLPLTARETIAVSISSAACGALALVWRLRAVAGWPHRTTKAVALSQFKKHLTNNRDKYRQLPSLYSASADYCSVMHPRSTSRRFTRKSISSIFADDLRVPSAGHRAVSIGQMVDLTEAFSHFIRDRSMYYVVPELVQPLTQSERLSYAEVAGCGSIDWFVSHFWGDPFAEFVQSLQRHAICEAERILAGSDQPRLSEAVTMPDREVWRVIRYWVCSFSVNQWSVDDELGDAHFEDTPFFQALWNSSCQGTVMVIQETAEPLKRSWCLFEVLQTVSRLDESKTSRFEGLQFATRSGVVNAGTASVDTVLRIAALVGDVYFEHARATQQKDQDMIRKVVQTRGGFAVLNRFVRSAVWDIVLESKRKLETSIYELGCQLRETEFAAHKHFEVTILGASGLRRADPLTSSSPSCVCRVLGSLELEPVQTGAVLDTAFPTWNFGPFHVEAQQVVGSALEFSVLDPDLRCSALLPFDSAWPSGFSGGLRLEGPGALPGATLTVSVAVASSAEQAAEEEEEVFEL
ncbi:unnamed protein product [Prorocentrum cordatum]|uniref:Receptor ligand binding region domain-containing protein n=1 Tax=Prorocentrum cordatum TaxID=2364126 RepID=A0ABN9VWU8_9DINO|nr:unnamed protein product [Polarella glacialis]